MECIGVDVSRHDDEVRGPSAYFAVPLLFSFSESNKRVLHTSDHASLGTKSIPGTGDGAIEGEPENVG